MELNEILQIALRGGASDIHLKAGLPPMFRVDGSLVPLKDGRRLPPEEVARMAFGIMNEFQKEKFKVSNEVDLAYGVPGLGRFRVNVFQQRGTVGAVLRVIPFKVMTMKDLLLPTVLEKVCGEERGLVLVTGTTGSGKSTTLAAMIDFINSNETNHIMTIEDPIEFLIRDKRSIVNQREVGVDTMSFSQALKSALRQDPDVILVGEMRDHETIETALHAAETGHLVMSTLHTLDATETINRIVSAFPPHQQKQVRLQLSSVLRGVVSQRLVPRADGKGRVAAVEVLRVTARVRELIEDKDRTKEIHDAISQGTDSYGMQTFDQSLMSLVRNGLVTYDEAHRQASNPDDFALRFSGISGTSDSKWDNFDAKAGEERPIPGSASFAQKGAPAQAQAPVQAPPAPVAQAPRPGAPMAARPATPPPGVAAPRPAGPPPGVVQGRPLPPQAPRPPAPAPVPAPAPAAGGDDDFQIERF
ncbi:MULTISPECIES: type IV pilus twitching motility protein PilT [Corallococcus]|uniref:type IV pilus twitching motility protein PilT n=1 Tax=Corallococcus TaxID=83461 RepID=UPI00117C606E|nr:MULTISPECIES: type IV pilus twitching motility protein PilT [Corallococcus]NBD13671.1 PilT/PilU family type 4a pilus ATPase [Corallococcus silvisoli]TSC20882.1 type IV pilus twitching motility protein PilT [Corallococcus sp. Z5C101001]